MIFYFNQKGEQLGLCGERVFQGSTKTNGVVMVCPATNANTVTARFELADEKTTCEIIMTRDQSFDVCKFQDTNGDLYSAWSCDMPNYVTQFAGVVRVQFFITSVEGVKKSTATTSFSVEEGVPSTEPEKFDTYNDLLNALTRISNDLETLKNNAGTSLYKHSVSGEFYDNLTNERVVIESLKIIDNSNAEITSINLMSRMNNALSITGSLTVEGSASNTYTPIKYSTNYGIPILSCIDHDSVSVRLMIFSSNSVSNWTCSKLQ